MALRIWEDYGEYTAAMQAARTKLDSIKGKLEGLSASFGDITFDEHCDPHVRVLTARPEARVSAKDAFDVARRYLSEGVWSLDELSHLADGWGSLLMQSLWNLGYCFGKRGKVNPLKPNALGVETKPPRAAYDALRAERCYVPFEGPVSSLPLRLDEVDSAGSYELRAGRTGMLLFALDGSPGGIVPAKFKGYTRGHIDTQQGNRERWHFYNAKEGNREIIVVQKGPGERVTIPARVSAQRIDDLFRHVEGLARVG